MSKQIRAAIAFFVLCMLQAVSIPAFATSVTPLQVELTSVGKGSRSQVTITNTGATPLPLETNLQVMELDENGERKLSNGGEDLLVFPPQAVVPAGELRFFECNGRVSRCSTKARVTFSR